MKKISLRFIACVLSVCMMGLPFTATAGLIGMDEVVTQQLSSERAKVSEFLARADVIEQLQQHGVTAQSAQERVGALTDNEVREIAGRIDSMPAGATAGGAAVIVIGLFIIALTYVIVRIFYPYK